MSLTSRQICQASKENNRKNIGQTKLNLLMKPIKCIVYTLHPHTMILWLLLFHFLTGGGNPFHNLEKTSVLQEVFYPFLCIFMNILCYDLKKNVINVVQLENAVHVDSFGFTVVFQTITIHSFTFWRWIIFCCTFLIDKPLWNSVTVHVYVLQARTFNETPINARKCSHILTKVLYLINQVRFSPFYTSI